MTILFLNSPPSLILNPMMNETTDLKLSDDKIPPYDYHELHFQKYIQIDKF